MQMGTQDFLPLDETLGSLGPPADLTQVCVQAGVLSVPLGRHCRVGNIMPAPRIILLCSISEVRALPLCSEAHIALPNFLMVRSSLDQQMPQEGAGEQVALLLDISNKFLWADNPTRPVCT